MNIDDIDRLARKRAKAKMSWFTHAIVYVVVNLMLIVQARATVSLLLGWGLGLALHGISVWLFAPGGTLLERMVAHESERLGGKGDQA